MVAGKNDAWCIRVGQGAGDAELVENTAYKEVVLRYVIALHRSDKHLTIPALIRELIDDAEDIADGAKLECAVRDLDRDHLLCWKDSYTQRPDFKRHLDPLLWANRGVRQPRASLQIGWWCRSRPRPSGQRQWTQRRGNGTAARSGGSPTTVRLDRNRSRVPFLIRVGTALTSNLPRMPVRRSHRAKRRWNRPAD
jgi:hypothetical protein